MGDVEEKPSQHYNLLGQPDPNGSLEGGACIWFVKHEDDKTLVLFQKRSENIQFGGFYDASTGGHIDEGEDPLTAALREAREEIGMDLNPEELRLVCSYATDRKYITVYLSDRTGKNDELKLNPEEVEQVEWIALDDLDMFIRARVKPPLRELVPHLPVLRYYIDNIYNENSEFESE
ncbi:NUDIX domain-containing protein [Candidatus Saccharibacteria bacterium]|nr:NUDIX domain-containing protein [Candidatus Saccharibacteria bacterium]